MNKIQNAIKCVNCKNVLDRPIILPCTHSICQKHAALSKSLDLNGSSLFCNACGIQHQIPLNGGFTLNLALCEIIDAKIGSLDLGKEHTDAKQACQNFEQLLDKIDNILADPANFIYEAIGFLKNVIQLKGDEMKLRIDEKMNASFEKLREYDDRCKDLLKTSEFKAKSAKFSLEKEKARRDFEKWMATLNEVKLNEEEWKRVKRESEKAIEMFKIELDRFKIELLLGEERFVGIQIQIEKDFGNFELDPEFDLGSGNNLVFGLDSEIVVEMRSKKKLMKLCEFDVMSVKWKLLYRGSLHGFGAADFHSKCDYTPKTLTIIKAAQSGNIFGGYTEATWDGGGICKKDKQAFIFSLVNKEKTPVKVNVAIGKEKAIVANAGYGPVFGNFTTGPDICINNNSNVSTPNYSKFGDCYALPKYPYGSEKTNNFLAGSCNFAVDEIEVFQRQ